MEGLEVGLDSMKNEFQRVQNIEKNMAVMLDQFNLLMEKWEEQEKRRKGKQSGDNKPMDSFFTSGVTLNLGGKSRDVGSGSC